MSLLKVSVVTLLTCGAVANPELKPSERCSDGECASDDMSLMALRTSARHEQTQGSPRPCVNRYGVTFWCGQHSTCCGDICAGSGSSCCQNQYGHDFVCAPGSTCGKNVCVADPGAAYNRSQDHPCINRHGVKFWCGKNSACCGDICAGPGSSCCQNLHGNDFVCAPGNTCCGNSCKAPGSRCCVNEGNKYPVTKDSKCAGWELGSRPCVNRYGATFWCSKDSTCCGDICAGAGSSCCQNKNGHDFVCAPGSKCGENVCVANTSSQQQIPQ